MMPCRAVMAAVLLALSAVGQETPAAKEVLQNTGAPMKLDFQCSEQDLHLTGLACSADQPCPVFLELAGIEPVGARIFIVGNTHTSSTTLSSVLLATDDNGKTWHEPFKRIHSAALDQVKFFDFQAGWISGYLMHALPHDPFLLLTTDGGATWRRRPLSDESRVGVIEKFQFDSRERGVLWLDRSQSGETDALYEQYESMTGGESWMLREVSTRPLLKDSRAAAPAGSGWRLRPDAKTNSYLIERGQGDKWQVVAGFLIPIGECKAPERQLNEPAEPAPMIQTPTPEPLALERKTGS